MNGFLVFNSDNGTLLLYNKYNERFGFDQDIKESHDALYLSTMIFTLYWNAGFIQVNIFNIILCFVYHAICIEYDI